jgi:hypothetical protein
VPGDERNAGGPSLPPTFSFVSIDAPNVLITAVKPVGNPVADHASAGSKPEQGILVRMYEAHGDGARAQLTFGMELEEAWLASLTEEKISDLALTRNGWSLHGLLKRRPSPTIVSVEVPACGIMTLGVRLTRPAQEGAPLELGPQHSTAAPVHCQYWEHNSGAAPMGNQPVTLWLRGPIPIGKNTRFTLGLSNDYRDREIVGRVRVIAPPQWPLIPKEVPYRIAPASQAVYEVMVVVPPDATPCFLRAMTEDDGRILQDVIPIGEILPLALSLTREQDALVAEVTNPNHDSVEGEVQLVTPVEAWGGLAEGLALAEVTPRSHIFRLEAERSQRFTFPARGDSEAMWAVAKVAWYGRVQYAVLGS